MPPPQKRRAKKREPVAPPMPATGRQFRLGKKPKRVDPRTLRFGRYVTPELPPPPASVDWQAQVPGSAWNIDGNDTYGDCTIAAAAHMVETWTYNADPNAPVNIPPATVVSDYLALTGGQDTGLDLLTVLNAWRQSGLPTGDTTPDKIFAYAELDLSDWTQLQQAIDIFGGAYIGVVLPDYILDQPLGQPWAIPAGESPPAPDPNNGHCVPLLGYDADYYYCLTWGVVTPVTAAFLAAYMDEAYAVLSQKDWIEATGESPAGFDFPQLQTDLTAITQESPPTPGPAPPQPPTSCSTILDQAEQAFLSGKILTAVEDLFAYIDCIVHGGAPAPPERHRAILETVRRRI